MEDIPVRVEPKGNTRTREDTADGVRRLDLELVFFLRWRVSNHDQ